MPASNFGQYAAPTQSPSEIFMGFGGHLVGY